MINRELKINNVNKPQSLREKDSHVAALFGSIATYKKEEHAIKLGKSTRTIAQIRLQAIIGIKLTTQLLKLNHTSWVEKLNAPDTYGYTPILEATEAGLLDVVAFLHEEGADPFAMTRSKETGLTLAAWTNQETCLAFFIHLYQSNGKTDFIDHPNAQGHTALMEAAGRGFDNCIKLLLEAHADLKKRNFKRQTSLILATASNHLLSLKLLLPGSEVDAQDIYGFTALNYAINQNNNKHVKELLEYKASPDLPCKEGNTPLIYAAANAQIEILDTLISAKANLNIQNKSSKNTALMYAAGSGLEMCLTKLIEAKADLNLQNTDGYTALMFAVTNNDTVQCASLLIEAGANLNHINFEGKTALQLAVKSHKWQMVTLILEKDTSKESQQYLTKFFEKQSDTTYKEFNNALITTKFHNFFNKTQLTTTQQSEKSNTFSCTNSP